MNLTWNLVRKDLRRLWLGAVLLSGVAALKFVLADRVFGAEVDHGWMSQMARYQDVLQFAQWIVSFVLALAVIHEDPVSEPGAFWEMLPVTRRQMLAAKCLGVLLLTILPVVLAVVVGWGALGLPWGALGWLVAVVLQAQVFLALLAMAFGSLTRNFAHVIYWLVGTIMAFMVSAVFPTLKMRVDGFPTPGARLTLFSLCIAVLVLCCVAVTCSQFLGRSRRRSVVIACVGIGLAALFPFLPPSWDAVSQFSSRQQELNREVAALPVKVLGASINSLKRDAPVATLVRLAIDDRATPFLLSIAGNFGRWRPEGESPVDTFARVYQPGDRANRRAVARAAGMADIIVPAEITLGLESWLSPLDAGRLHPSLIPYEGEIEIGAQSVTIEGELDLVSGAALQTESGSCRLVRVERDKSTVGVEYETRDSGVFADRGDFLGVNALFAPQSHYDYALVNRGTRQVLAYSRASSGIATYAYGAWLSRGKMEFVLPAAGSSPDLMPWRLVRVRYGPIGRAVRSFRQEVQLEAVSSLERDPTWMP